MSTPSGPPYQTQSSTPWIVRGTGASSSHQPPPTVRSTAYPNPITRKETENLLKQIADEHFNSALTLYEESKSHTKFSRRHTYERQLDYERQQVLHHLAQSACSTREYLMSGNDTHLQGALDDFTKACTLHHNGEAAAEIEQFQSAAFLGILFGRKMDKTSIFPENNRLPRQYFESVKRTEYKNTTPETKSAMEATLKTAMERSDNLMTIYGNGAYPAGSQRVWSTRDSQRAEHTDEREQRMAQPDHGNLSVPETGATAYGGCYGSGQEWWEK